MVEEEFGGSSASNKPTYKFTETFEKMAPKYMAMGMSYDEFWNDDIRKARDYLEAFKIRKKQENEKLWLQGMYIYKALENIYPLFNGWANTPPKPYLKHPIPMDEEDRKEQKEADAREEMLAMKRYLDEQVEKGEKKQEG